VRIHRKWAIIALVPLLVVQIYWLIGNNLVKDIPILSDDPEKFKEAAIFFALYDQAKEARKEKADNPQIPTSPRTQTEIPIVESSSSTPVQTQLTQQQEFQKQPENEITERDFTIMGINNTRIQTSVWLLKVWNIPGELSSAVANYFVDFPDDANIAWRSAITAKYMLNIMQAYILPMLYGWLGAVAYALRNLISETRNRTYREESEFGSRLRTYLGLLSGLAIGWFIEPTSGNKTIMQVVSPLALAFLAGYCVELLFTTMDTLLSGFTSGQSKKA
jgi:hypothetical protein